MDEIKLRYFTSVARHLNFTKAAEDCHVTQSTISKQISALEEELGAKLFYRDHHSVRLTPAGAKLANDSEDYMEHYRLINESIKKLHLEMDQRLTIGVGPLEHAILEKPLRVFTQRYPHVEVYCTLYTHKRMVSHFRSGTFDVGICTRLCTDMVTGLKVRGLGYSDWYAAAPVEDAFWNMKKEDQAVLRDQTVITLYENEFEPVRPYCIKNSMQNRAFTYSNQLPTLVAMLRGGMGISLLPGFLQASAGADLRMENLLEHPLRMEYVVAANADVHNTAADDFMEVCGEVYDGVSLLQIAGIPR